MPSAGCPNRRTLLQYSIGVLPDDQSDDLSGHIDSCADCQATILTLEDAEDTLINGLRTPRSESCLAEPEFQAAMAEALATPAARKGAVPFSRSAMPQTLGEYQLLEELGRGGMGRVYKALHTKLDRVVALKILSRGRVGDPQAIARFEREMKAVGRLTHPHIVQAHDAREINQTPVLIMEFVDGLDLAEIVRRVGPLPVAESCELMRQTALALQCAHEHGLVHRDVKPSNIMLGRSGEVKLLDLGLARFYDANSRVGMAQRPGLDVREDSVGHAHPTDEMTATGQAMGTADYMAPEQAADSREVDIRADLYSLGCTLYKILSGRAPFSGPAYRTTLEKLNAHVHQPIPPIRQLVPDVPERLATIVDRLLAKNPDDRFATPAEVAEALAPLCVGADLSALLKRAVESPRFPLPSRDGQSEGRAALSSQNAPSLQWGGFGVRLIVVLSILLLLVGGLGFYLGITLRIQKDGRETTVEVPEGSNARVSASGDVAIDVTEKTEPVPTGRYTISGGGARLSANTASDLAGKFSLRTTEGVAITASDQPQPKVAASPKESPLLFGPVVERVVNAASEGKGGSGINLSGGKLVDVPKEFGQWSAQQQDKWSTENDVDLVVDLVANEGVGRSPNNKTLTLVPGRLKLATIVNDRWHWQDVSSGALHQTLESATPGSPDGGIPVVDVFERHGIAYYGVWHPPVTFTFQTRKSELGLLQIIRFTEEPQGMRIRYKLAHSPNQPDVSRNPNESERLAFRLATVTRGDLTATIAATGTLEPQEVRAVTAKVAGQIIALGDEGKPIDYGSPVEEGAVLAQIDPTVYKARLDQEEGSFEKATAELEAAQAKAEHSTSQTAATAKPLVAAARAALKQSEAALTLARTNWESTVIRSPIKGVVIDRRVDVGQNVGPTPNAPALFLIAKDLGKVQVWASVHEADIAQIHKGTDVRVALDAFPKEVFHGKVVQVRLNATRTQDLVAYMVVVAVDNPAGKLLPYMTANLRFQGESRQNVLRVPNAALRWKPRRDQMAPGVPQTASDVAYLWVTSGSDQQVQLVKVQVGLSAGGVSEVSGPDVKEGMQVVVGEEARVMAVPSSSKLPDQPIKLPDQSISAPHSNTITTAGPEEKTTIEGTWEIADSSFNLVKRLPQKPEPTPEQVFKTTRVIITAEALKIVGPHVTDLTFTYQLNPAAKTIDLHMPRAMSDLFSIGIYQLDADRLKICTSGLQTCNFGSREPPGMRPSDFWAEIGSDQELLVLRRVGAAAIVDDENVIRGKWQVEEAPDGLAKLGFGKNQQIDFFRHVLMASIEPDVVSPAAMEGRLGGQVPGERRADPLGRARMGGAPSVMNIRHYSYALDPTATPKRIDLVGGELRSPLHGVYQLDRQWLTIAWAWSAARPGPLPPATLAAGPKTALLVLKRVTRDGPVPGLEEPIEQPDRRTAPANPTAELKAMQGPWKIVSIEKGKDADSLWAIIWGYDSGTKDPATLRRLSFGDGLLQMMGVEKVGNHEAADVCQPPYQVNPTAAPKTIELYQPNDSPNQERRLTALGIYEIEGERLKICLTRHFQSLKGVQPPPRRFAVEPGVGDILLTLERYRPSADETAMQGQWSIAESIEDGKPVAPSEVRKRNARFTDWCFDISDDSAHWWVNGVFTLDEAKQPKRIAILPYGGDTKDDVRLGIYKFDGDRLTIAFRKGGPLPEKFESKPGSGVTLLVLKK
jgi:RND family efflux transporter MFP subunit